MNDIDILEELVVDARKEIIIEERQAILNLITENKELKEENDLLKSKLNIWENLKNEDFILKSKVEELRAKIYKVLDVNAITRAFQLYIDNEFKNILGKE